jgi:hypothetical protein
LRRGIDSVGSKITFWHCTHRSSYMSKNLAREEIEEDIRFDFTNHILDQDFISNCRLLRLPCAPKNAQDFVESFYRYATINTNCEVWYLDFYNQSAQDISLPQTLWNDRTLFCV